MHAFLGIAMKLQGCILLIALKKAKVTYNILFHIF